MSLTDRSTAAGLTGQASLKQQYQRLPPAAERAQAELDAFRSSVTEPDIRYFHKIELIPRDGERPPPKTLSLLRRDADKVFWLPDLLCEYARIAARDDCPPHLRRYRNYPWRLPVFRKVIVVRPQEDALGRLAKEAWLLHAVEFALDRIFASDCDALSMDDFIVCYGWQPRHGTRRQHSYGASNYFSEKRRRGINLTGYGDKKSTSHREARAVGKDALASKIIGLYSTADLPAFDDARHAAFWKVYDRYGVVDLEHLGRWLSNRRHGERRRKPHIEDLGDRCPGLTYPHDLRRGDNLMRVFGAHPNREIYTTQSFIDGFSSWLKEVKDTPTTDRPWLIPLTLF